MPSSIYSASKLPTAASANRNEAPSPLLLFLLFQINSLNLPQDMFTLEAITLWVHLLNSQIISILNGSNLFPKKIQTITTWLLVKWHLHKLVNVLCLLPIISKYSGCRTIKIMTLGSKFHWSNKLSTKHDIHSYIFILCQK